MALVEASKIYRKHLNPFIQFFDVGKELLFDRAPDTGLHGFSSAPMGAPAATVSSPATSPMTIPTSAPVRAPAGDADLRQKLELPIAHMDLSVRASNCLEAEGVQTIGDLVRYTQDDLMAFKNFGRTSLKEITRKLDEMNLSLGMDVGE